MTIPQLALLAFVFWTVLLLAGIGVIRVSQVLSGKASANAFPSGQPHGAPFYWRLNRAHANCLENLPLFASVVLLAHASGFSAAVFDNLAQTYMAARVGQTLAHLSSGSNLAVNVRFSFFLTQIVCLVWMGALLI